MERSLRGDRTQPSLLLIGVATNRAMQCCEKSTSEMGPDAGNLPERGWGLHAAALNIQLVSQPQWPSRLFWQFGCHPAKRNAIIRFNST